MLHVHLVLGLETQKEREKVSGRKKTRTKKMLASSKDVKNEKKRNRMSVL